MRMKTNYFPRLNNEQGALMVFALLITATLTIAGIMVANDALMESRIARNYAIKQQCFRAAEAAALELGQQIENMSVADIFNAPWFYDGMPGSGWTFNRNNWGGYNTRASNVEGTVNFIQSADAIVAMEEPPDTAPPPVAGMGSAPTLYRFAVYGRAVHAGPGNSEALLRLGYRRRI